MKALVTGAGGFIGYNLANALAGRGHDVIGIDLHFPEAPGKGREPKFRAETGDFRNGDLMAGLMEGVEIVYHLASAHLQVSLKESEYWDVNVHSLRPLMELAREKGARRFVHTSSVGVYGNLKVWPANEESNCHPQSIYGETKLAGEDEVTKYHKETGFPAVTLRPAWVYGPGCPRTEKLYRTLRKGRFVMIGKGDNLRHPVFIDDMIQAFELAAEKDEALGDLFIIGGERAITTQELVADFARALDVSKPKIRLPYGLGVFIAATSEAVFGLAKMEPPISRRTLEFFDTNNAFEITKAREVLGYNPRFSFAEGLSESKRWLLNSD